MDAGTVLDAEAGPPACPPNALFCDDFEGTPVKTKWDRDYDDDGLIASADGKAGRGLVVNVTARDASKNVSAFLEQPASLEAKKPFTVSFDLDVSAVKDVGIVDVDCFRYHGPFLAVGLRIADYGTGTIVHYFGDAIGGGSILYDEIEVEALPAATWVRIACEVTYPTADPNVRITFDGREIFNQKVPVAAYVGKPYLAVGVTKTDHAGPALTVRFDNFAFTSP